MNEKKKKKKLKTKEYGANVYATKSVYIWGKNVSMMTMLLERFFFRPVLTFPKYDTLNYKTPLKL